MIYTITTVTCDHVGTTEALLDQHSTAWRRCTCCGSLALAIYTMAPFTWMVSRG